VREALIAKGHPLEQLPSERTLRDILNRMNYRLKRIQKGKPLAYVQFREFGFIVLVTVWGKNDKSDLSVKDRRDIAAMIRDIRRTLGGRRNR
jgi:hypothetical protein